jgi:hypothetical protein
VYAGALAEPLVPVIVRDCSAASQQAIADATTATAATAAAVMVVIDCSHAVTAAMSTGSSGADTTSVSIQHSGSTCSIQHVIDMARAAGAAVVTVILVSSMTLLSSHHLVENHTCVLNLTSLSILISACCLHKCMLPVHCMLPVYCHIQHELVSLYESCCVVLRASVLVRTCRRY